MHNNCINCSSNYFCLSANFTETCSEQRNPKTLFTDILKIQHQRIMLNAHFENILNNYSEELSEEINRFFILFENLRNFHDPTLLSLDIPQMQCKDCMVNIKCSKKSEYCFIQTNNKTPNQLLDDIKNLVVKRLNKGNQTKSSFKKTIRLLKKTEPYNTNQHIKKGGLREFFLNTELNKS